ncbi:autotransporter domain-containing protein [Reyranella sp.]|uniref:autotransporter outer membrane beta-barrel domain-containing protein n=1 Tax=Reyranella sp. TaxID=1929291 RepID=UPI0037842FFE
MGRTNRLKRIAVNGALAVCLPLAPAYAQDATWLANPVGNIFRDPGNWSPAVVPTGTATFGPSTKTLVALIDSGTSVDRIAFAANAPPYILAIFSNGVLTLTGAGIANASPNLASFEVYNGSLTLQGAATLGQSRVVGMVATGALNISGLTAASTTVGSIEGNGVVNLGAKQLIVGGNNLSTTFTGRIDGAGGSIVKVGSGSLTLTGANSYGGGTTVSAGVLQGNATSLRGDITNNATVVFDQGNTGLYAGNMSGTGGLAKQGSGLLALSGTNSFSGGTTVNGGTLQLASSAALLSGSALTINGGTLDLNGHNLTVSTVAGSGGALALGTATLTAGNAVSATLAAAISGTGGLVKQGPATLTLTGASTYTGPTTVNSGILAVNGSLASNVTIGSSGAIGGTGVIGGLTNNGGIISPGNAIGTLTIAGNLAQTGGTYVVEVNNGGQSDRMNVGGRATVNGGTVAVQAQPGTYARNTSYTILNAVGGVSGTFSNVTSNFAFLVPSLSYDANNVYLQLFQSANAFAAGAQTANQYAVGRALDQANATATGDFANVLNALSTLDAVQGPAALNAISGQNYSGFSSAMVQGAQLFLSNFLSQAGGASRGAAKLALAEMCDVACDATEPGRWGAWGGGLGGAGTIAGNANAATLTYSVGGFAAGLDRKLGDNFRAGVTVGYTSGQQWVGGFDGKGISNTILAGVYGGYAQGPVYVDGIVGYAYSSNQMWRTIVIPGLQPRTAQGLTGANQFYGQVETGYRFDLGGTAQAFVTPFARLQGFTGTQNAFSESGAQSLNLNVAAQTTNSLRSVLGAQMGGAMDMGWRDKLNAQVRLGWSHEYANTDRPVTASFAGAPTIPFTTFGASPQRDGVVIGLAFNTAIAQASSIYLRYEGDISGQDSNHALAVGLRMTW